MFPFHVVLYVAVMFGLFCLFVSFLRDSYVLCLFSFVFVFVVFVIWELGASPDVKNHATGCSNILPARPTNLENFCFLALLIFMITRLFSEFLRFCYL